LKTPGAVVSAIFRRLIDQQAAWSKALDRHLPADLSINAWNYFHEDYVGQWITPNSRVYDVGGGRFPAIAQAQKVRQHLHIVGLDLSLEELGLAPPGSYDQTTAADIMTFEGDGDADFIVSGTVLEHVKDTSQAFRAFRSILKPGGHALIFVPSRNAIFARLNRLLPQSWKLRLLALFFPATQGSGWPAYYDRCTPSDFRRLAEANGFEVVHLRPFYHSAYFRFCFPLYAAWRLWILVARSLIPEQGAETFCMCIKKRQEGHAHSLSLTPEPPVWPSGNSLLHD
jgi:SAM-dependent methyltransferase